MKNKSIYELFGCKDKDELYDKLCSQSSDVSSLSDFINYVQGDVSIKKKAITEFQDVLNFANTLDKPTKEKLYIIGVNNANKPIMLSSFNPTSKNGFREAARDLIQSGSAKSFLIYDVSTHRDTIDSISDNLGFMGISVLDELRYFNNADLKDVFLSASGHAGVYEHNEEAVNDTKIKSSRSDILEAKNYDEFVKHYVSKQILGKDINTDKDKIQGLLKFGFQYEPREEVGCVLYDKNNKVFDMSVLFTGGTTTSVIDNRILVKYVLEHENVKGFIMFHNHPSGNLNPSKDDIHFTKNALGASNIFDIEFNDHFIVSTKGVFSFKDNNLVLENNQEKTMSNKMVSEAPLAYGFSETKYAKKQIRLTGTASAVEYINNRMLYLLENDKPLPFLPNANGECDVNPVMDANGYEFTGIQQLAAKMYLYERGVPRDNICTFRQATKNHTTIKPGERGFLLPAFDKKNNKEVAIRYFALSQTNKKDRFYIPYKASKNIMPFEQKDSNTQNYLRNYLKCVRDNRPFVVTYEIADEFKKELVKQIKNDPHVLLKICKETKICNQVKQQEQNIER